MSSARPRVEGDFAAPWLEHLLGGDLRHTIEPALSYRYVTGINNFRQILRFDQTDVASNTNEMEYGLTQRLFVRHLPPHPCKGDEALGPNPMCGGGTRDWISWRVAQKYYFEPDFDGAITPGTPNPLETTLDFTGVDFLTGSRHTTPVISRLRMRTTTATDAEWDLDYDVKEGRITSSNVFAAYQHGYYRFQFGDSYMNVPLGVTPLKINPVAVGFFESAQPVQPDSPGRCLWRRQQAGPERGNQCRLRSGPPAAAVRRSPGFVQLELLRAHVPVSEIFAGLDP